MSLKSIGENGCLLSGGERQRLILARTFLQDKDIIVLDEPFNNLDVELKQNLWNRIQTDRDIKTYIIISHNQYDDNKADHIININNIL